MKQFYTSAYLYRDTAFLRGFANGKRFNDEFDIKPYLFFEGKGPYKTLDGKICYKKEFKNVKEARDFIKRYDDIENFHFYGMTNFIYPFLNDNFPGEIEFDADLIEVTFLDIEVSSKLGMPLPHDANQEVTAITLLQRDNIITFGTKYYKPKNPKVTYILCNDECDLLNKFLITWSENYPDVVSGWNVDLYDFPYLINRIPKVLGERAVKMLSPWKMINEKEIVRAKTSSSPTRDIDKRTDKVYEIAGIAQLDYLQLYKKFTNINHESYRLDNIALFELNKRKLDYSMFEGLEDLYEKDPERFYDYNIHDCVLVKELDEKLNFIRQIVTLAYKAKINYMDAFTTTRPWDVVIHNYLLSKNIVIPQIKKNIDRRLEGAYVHEVQPGMHNHVVSFDFKSLYPSIISQHNISPETFVRNSDTRGMLPITDIIQNKTIGLDSYLKNQNITVCANKCAYTKNFRGFLPELVDKYIADRDAIKKRMITLKQENQIKKDKEIDKEIGQLGSMEQSLKILSNGLYGALANVYFRWFDINLAESVTLTGQLYILWVMNQINEYLGKIVKEDRDFCVAGDTDSLFLDLGLIVQKLGITNQLKAIDFLDNLCKQKLEPVIAKSCKELGDLLNSYNNVIVAKREVLCDKAIWRKKKNYILNVWDKEGVRESEPKLILKGIEAVRSSTPMICRNKIKEALKIIMQKDEKTLQAYLAEFKKEFMKLPYEEMAFPRSIDGINLYYDPITIFRKSTPLHIRGAIVYNEYLKRIGVTRDFRAIKDKDKIRYVYLKEPNPMKSYIVSFPDEGNLPKQFSEIIPYVDKDMQWEKAFEGPIKSITELIGWELVKRNKIDMLFD